jgi:hypothetical protein
MSAVLFAYQFQCKNEYGDLWRDEVGAWPHLMGHLLRMAVFSTLVWCLWRYLRAMKRLRNGGQPELEGLLASLSGWWTTLAVGALLLLLYGLWIAYGDVQRSPVQPLSPRYLADTSDTQRITAEFRLAETESKDGLLETAIPGTSTRVFLHKEAALTNRDIATARVVVAFDGQPAVDFTVKEGSQQKMRDVTSTNIGKYLVVLVDGRVVTGASILAPIRSSGRVHGEFTRLEAEEIAKALTGKASLFPPGDAR